MYQYIDRSAAAACTNWNRERQLSGRSNFLHEYHSCVHLSRVAAVKKEAARDRDHAIA